MSVYRLTVFCILRIVSLYGLRNRCTEEDTVQKWTLWLCFQFVPLTSRAAKPSPELYLEGYGAVACWKTRSSGLVGQVSLIWRWRQQVSPKEQYTTSYPDDSSPEVDFSIAHFCTSGFNCAMNLVCLPLNLALSRGSGVGGAVVTRVRGCGPLTNKRFFPSPERPARRWGSFMAIKWPEREVDQWATSGAKNVQPGAGVLSWR